MFLDEMTKEFTEVIQPKCGGPQVGAELKPENLANKIQSLPMDREEGAAEFRSKILGSECTETI